MAFLRTTTTLPTIITLPKTTMTTISIKKHKKSTGEHLCFAVTEQYDVYIWGGGGTVRTFDPAKKNEVARKLTSKMNKKVFIVYYVMC